MPKIYLILYPSRENLTTQISYTDGCISLSLSSFVCCTFCLPSPASKFTARFLRSESWQILSCAIWAMLVRRWAYFGSTPSARRRKLCWIRFYADIRNPTIYNIIIMLVWWFDETKDSLTKHLMFQAYFLLNSLIHTISWGLRRHQKSRGRFGTNFDASLF